MPGLQRKVRKKINACKEKKYMNVVGQIQRYFLKIFPAFFAFSGFYDRSKKCGNLSGCLARSQNLKTVMQVKQKSKPINKDWFNDIISPWGYSLMLYFCSTAVSSTTGDTEHSVVMFFHYYELYKLSDT